MLDDKDNEIVSHKTCDNSHMCRYNYITYVCMCVCCFALNYLKNNHYIRTSLLFDLQSILIKLGTHVSCGVRMQTLDSRPLCLLRHTSTHVNDDLSDDH